MSMEDQAQELELKQWVQNNKTRQVEKTYKPGDSNYGPANCLNCDEAMPVARREYGYALCTGCKTELEQRRRKTYG
jgi:RNA polymerase-binding transcription factor DksA